jgi:hypothetical protein
VGGSLFQDRRIAVARCAVRQPRTLNAPPHLNVISVLASSAPPELHLAVMLAAVVFTDLRCQLHVHGQLHWHAMVHLNHPSAAL